MLTNSQNLKSVCQSSNILNNFGLLKPILSLFIFKRHMKKISTLLCFCFISLFSFAQDGFNIKVKIDGFERDSVFLGYHYGDKQFLRDTAIRGEKDWFEFKGDKALDGGMYLIVMPPDNKFFEVLVDKGNQNFSIHTDFLEPNKVKKIEGSVDNKLFYDYLNFIGSMRPKAEGINKEKEAAAGNDAKLEKLQKKMEGLNQQVQDRQAEILKMYPNSLVTGVIKANKQPEFPKFEGTDEEINVAKWRWYLEHYFDNIDLKDDRLVRTSFLFQKIQYYMEKLTVQHPDSLIKSIDFMLERMEPEGDNFKYYLVHFLNKYAKSKLVGMDAVYVHLVKKYYKTGLASWTPDSTLQKIVKNADELDPILIGKPAPDIQLQYKSGEKVRLYEIESPYTILYIWDPECGHCKKAAPHMVEFYEKFKDKGVKVLSICTKFTDEVPSCWESVEEKEFTDFMNVVDPYHRSKYKIKYNIKSTPQTFILDKDKKIIMKKIGAEQMIEVMDQIILDDQKKMDEGK